MRTVRVDHAAAGSTLYGAVSLKLGCRFLDGERDRCSVPLPTAIEASHSCVDPALRTWTRRRPARQSSGPTARRSRRRRQTSKDLKSLILYIHIMTVHVQRPRAAKASPPPGPRGTSALAAGLMGAAMGSRLVMIGISGRGPHALSVGCTLRPRAAHSVHGPHTPAAGKSMGGRPQLARARGSGAQGLRDRQPCGCRPGRPGRPTLPHSSPNRT
jgi:hypothetical protein